jgi:hypothetical protein
MPLLSLVALLAAACRPLVTTPPTTPAEVHLTILVDGDVQSYTLAPGLTVREAVATAGITLGELDQVDPPPFTVISEGLGIVITRVTERFETEDVQVGGGAKRGAAGRRAAAAASGPGRRGGVDLPHRL